MGAFYKEFGQTPSSGRQQPAKWRRCPAHVDDRHVVLVPCCSCATVATGPRASFRAASRCVSAARLSATVCAEGRLSSLSSPHLEHVELHELVLVLIRHAHNGLVNLGVACHSSQCSFSCHGRAGSGRKIRNLRWWWRRLQQTPPKKNHAPPRAKDRNDANLASGAPADLWSHLLGDRELHGFKQCVALEAVSLKPHILVAPTDTSVVGLLRQSSILEANLAVADTGSAFSVGAMRNGRGPRAGGCAAALVCTAGRAVAALPDPH
mmetsp:Transcript_86606/g.149868  ORF Transcript_86606/g.149868 Transcript_86606/m.149868 type:complete len:265 (-) Transcript_86606:3916-4710(-)